MNKTLKIFKQDVLNERSKHELSPWSQNAMDYSCVRESGMVEVDICSQIIFETHEIMKNPR